MARTRDNRAGERDDSDVGGNTSLLGRIRLIAGLVALGALVIFLAQNLQEVEIHFLWLDWNTRMLWALLAAALTGALAMVLFATLRRRDLE